ncbi:helix-turn-helix transcriptional regulator [Actinoplanes bogorensis]|uniref:Helix-turn-helix transcriptional regulator n=1 Tax=Paractinoplanes bogorensis TaxID=1610840 RepID=A0ABS5YVB3_9ACTN|nr:helix-turn-helix transcriptional regulator [Actinoplanes bogorensis]MBU2667392.1 helix-turn-helix transcriptional regulator [Actinoplanes bogorensis]
MSSDLEADRLAASGDPRQVFQAFLVLTRNNGAADLRPLVERMSGFAEQEPFLHEVVTGVTLSRIGSPDAAAHLERALELFDTLGLHEDPLYLECAIFVTLTLIRPHEVREKFLRHVVPLDDPVSHARLLAMIGLADAWGGNLVRGQAVMTEARELAARAGRRDVQAEVTSWLIKCEALRGDLESSSRHLAEARELAGRNGSEWVAGHILEGSAALHFALGDTEAWAAMLELLVANGRGVDSGLVFEFRWELATHHALAGDVSRAAGLLDGVPEAPVHLPGGPAMAAWRAWILNPLDEASSSAFEAALPLLTRPPERLPRARMSWLLGVAHARAGRRANAVRLMEGSCAGYAAIGAAGMVSLVMADLRALSVSDGRPPGLTGAERRVAVAVADGLSNKEAAEQLFVSVKTVEFHLGNIFRKLDVRNRTELAGRRSTFD